MTNSFNIEQFLSLEGYDTEERVSRRKDSKVNSNEFFTPYSIVKKMADKISPEDWADPNKIWLESSFGNGRIEVTDFIDKKLNDEEMEKIAGTKHFDICLMNPPYSGSLHLKFLEKVIKLSDKAVSVQPITFLQNPFGDKTGNKQVLKYKLTDVELLGKLHKVFPSMDGHATYDVGIIYCDKNAKVNTDLQYDFIEIYKDKLIDPKLIKSVKEKISDYCEKNNLEDNIKYGEINENSKYCIVIPLLVGNVGVKVNMFYDEYSNRWGRIFYKGKSEGKKVGEYKKKLSNVKNYTKFSYLEFDTEQECKNWIKSQYSKIMQFITILNSVDSHRRCKYVPYMNNYKEIWTDDKLSKFFKFTDNEVKQIINYVDDYNKHFNRIYA